MTSREEEASLILDAFYVDEFGVKNTPYNIDSRAPRGTPLLSKNKFTTVTPLVDGVIRESAQSLRLKVTNKANPRYNSLLSGQPVQANIPSNILDEHRVWVYISPSTKARANALKAAPWDRPIQVSILYAVRTEMNRHGLRSAMETRREPSALILVPGIEPDPGSPRWGVGINQIDLQNLLNAAVGRQVTFQTKVMAAYSTGANLAAQPDRREPSRADNFLRLPL
ncbi:hypothetical protein [Bacillus pseudomycoides]|uniref:hypothetical protein n=1 Tax=Bacillus pseudomycoides TaxID=64104 RepID=UPI000BF582E5|nr:hypothetical protein [Bacillus pseudomycoides]PEP87430.1 hypothetical protein CN584_04500 [Bacillus pseudomycoides]